MVPHDHPTTASVQATAATAVAAVAAAAALAARAVLIDAALARRNYAAHLRGRIEGLLDGREDRTRLRCCNSGCFVCVQELQAVVAEVEAVTGAAAAVTDGA